MTAFHATAVESALEIKFAPLAGYNWLLRRKIAKRFESVSTRCIQFLDLPGKTVESGAINRCSGMPASAKQRRKKTS